MSEFLKVHQGLRQDNKTFLQRESNLATLIDERLRKARIELSDTDFMADTKETLRAKTRSIVSRVESNPNAPGGAGAGGSGPDTTPPQIVSVTTSSGNANISTSSSFIITVNEPVRLSSTWSNFLEFTTLTYHRRPQSA